MKFLQTGFSCHYENAYFLVELVQSAEISVHCSTYKFIVLHTVAEDWKFMVCILPR
jgi:hypothetical protein